mmetsp:Transcript_30646/g.47023  ORF Transcript_30646/g.47023 Transcript_30646/m.47023 type:complete len:84 (+) Transcript_30646:375-626(+)
MVVPQQNDVRAPPQPHSLSVNQEALVHSQLVDHNSAMQRSLRSRDAYSAFQQISQNIPPPQDESYQGHFYPPQPEEQEIAYDQ